MQQYFWAASHAPVDDVYCCIFVMSHGQFLCVGHTGVLCRNGRTDHELVWGQADVPPRNHVLHREADLLHEKEHF